jgi:hypothetical protein
MGGTSEEKVKRTMQQYYTAVTLSVKNILQAAEFLNASTAVEEVEVLRGDFFTFDIVKNPTLMHFVLFLSLSPSQHPSLRGRSRPKEPQRIRDP